VTGDEMWFTAAEAQLGELRSRFAADGGGFHTTPASSDLIARPVDTQDNPTPSENALAMEALLVHAALTGDRAAVSEAETTMKRIAATAVEHPGFGGYALAVWMTHLVGFREVALVGADTRAMQDVVWRSFHPEVVMAIGDGGPTDVPLLANRPGTPTGLAYVCKDLVCDLPVDTPEALATSLAR
jgi:uncharacterized protein